MAKHKYRQKKVNTEVVDVPEAKIEETTVTPLETESAPMTKRARRRAKEAESLPTSVDTNSQGSKERVVTSQKYKAMTSTRTKPAKTKKSNQRKGIETQQSFGKKVALWFRAMKAELKAVTWPSFKSTTKVTGVWANIGTVFLVVLFFLVILTGFDSGLTSLFKLLVGIGGA